MEMVAALGPMMSGLGSLGSVASSSSVLTALQGGATAASIIGSMSSSQAAVGNATRNAGIYQFAASNALAEGQTSAAAEETNARQEYIAGASAAASLRENLIRTIGSQRVAFAASGVDPTSGSARTLEDAAAVRTSQDLETLAQNTELAALQRQIKASQIRQRAGYQAFASEGQAMNALSQGEAAATKGAIESLGSLFKFGVDVAKRG